MHRQITILTIILTASFLLTALPVEVCAKKWDIKADSVELTGADIDRPYEIKEVVSLKIKRRLAEELALEAQDRLRKTAADKGCDAVIFVDHYTERDPTELYTNAILVQTLDSTEAAEREKNYISPDEVKEQVDNKEIILVQGDINCPYKIKWIADVIVGDGDASTMRTVDGQLIDVAKKNNGHAVIFIRYDRAGTEVSGAKGIVVRFARRWLKSGESSESE
ncbi:MAG: hypothetical protein ABIK83_14420 [Candidatus Zixiibacteriota bacterium]